MPGSISCLGFGAATLPSAEQEKRATEAVQPARLAARLRAMRKLTAANTNTAFDLYQPDKEKVGVVGSSGRYRAVRLSFYASYRRNA